MNSFNLQNQSPPRVLATDLDGTLIPLPEHPENRTDLARLAQALETEAFAEIVFATGRHYESVREAIETHDLPRPEWMVCDVGTSLYKLEGERHARFGRYEDHLAGLVRGWPREAVEEALAGFDGLELQGDECQKPHKISYFCDAKTVDDWVTRIAARCDALEMPFTCMGSVDPFDNRGLLDLLPLGVSKAYALIWLSTHAGFAPGEIIYAGDSGNDFAALVCGFRAILVGNASEELRAKVETAMAEKDLSDRLYCAKAAASSGVWEGCRHFGLL